MRPKTRIHSEAAGANHPSQPAARPHAPWRLPPELTHCVPRPVRLSAAGRVLAGCVVAMLAGAVASGVWLYVSGERNRARRSALDRESITAQAQVVQVGRRRGESNRRFIVYRYVVGAQAYERRQTLRGGDRRKLKAGDTVAIRYVPATPATAWLIGYQPGAAPLWLVAVVPAVLLLLAWLTARLLEAQRRLLSEGRAVAARVVASTSVYTGSSAAYQVEYEFQVLSGATRRVKLQASKKPDPDTMVTIIYDRENTRKAARYPLSLATVASRRGA